MSSVHCTGCGSKFNSGKGLDCPNCGEKRKRSSNKARKCLTCGKVHSGICPRDRGKNNPSERQNFVSTA